MYFFNFFFVKVTNLQRHLRVQYKLGDLLSPRQPFLGLVVQEVVKDGTL